MNFNSSTWKTEASYKAPLSDSLESGLAELVVHRIKELLAPPAEKVATLRDIVNVAVWDAQELIINRIPAQRFASPDEPASRTEDAAAQPK